MTEAAEAFIAQARSLLSADYLAKIEQCLERLSDEEVWWRAYDESNSVGNLVRESGRIPVEYMEQGSSPPQTPQDTEIAQRLEGHSTSLCPLCALCVSVVNYQLS